MDVRTYHGYKVASGNFNKSDRTVLIDKKDLVKFGGNAQGYVLADETVTDDLGEFIIVGNFPELLGIVFESTI